MKMVIQDLGAPPPYYMRPKTAYFRVVLRRHHNLCANVFGMKQNWQTVKRFFDREASPTH